MKGQPRNHPQGLACIRCGCQHLSVVYTRPRAGYILRVRECRHCGRRLTTREQTVGGPPVTPV